MDTRAEAGHPYAAVTLPTPTTPTSAGADGQSRQQQRGADRGHYTDSAHGEQDIRSGAYGQPTAAGYGGPSSSMSFGNHAPPRPAPAPAPETRLPPLPHSLKPASPRVQRSVSTLYAGSHTAGNQVGVDRLRKDSQASTYAASETSPRQRRSPPRAVAAATTSVPPLRLSPSTSHSQPAPAPSSSKSVLTVALQRAQSAVLLDSASNYPAAIAAYSQAVRLLKQVMARVEDGSREMERKRSEAGDLGAREGESMEEWEKRRARYERKEKAKLDEARRLRVIHDTYEDRIRMLVQMGTPLPPLSPTFSAPASSFPITTTSSLPTSSSSLPSAAASPARTPTNHERQPSSPLDPNGPANPAPHPYAYSPGPTFTAGAAKSTLPDLPHTDGDGQGIGAAMLQLARRPAAGEEEEPRDAHYSPAGGRRATEPIISRLPVVVSAPGESSLGEIGSATSANRGLSPTPSTSTAREMRPLSFASDSTAIAIARSVAPSTPTYYAPHPDASSPSLAGGGSPSFLDTAPLSPLDPVLAHIDGTQSSEDDTLQPRSPTVAVAVAPAMRRGASAGALTTSSGGSGSGSRSRTASMVDTMSTAPDMQRGYSTGSITPLIRRGSSIAALAYIEEGGVSPVEIRPRPARGTSLGGSAAMLPTIGTLGSAGLVNSTTVEGTISQRRQARSPQPGEQSLLDAADPDANIIVRAPSTDTERSGGYAFPPAAAADDFGRPTDSARHASWTTGSLPTRLRAQSSSSGKRAKLPIELGDGIAEEEDHHHYRPPVPPLEIPHALASAAEWRLPSSHRPSPSASSLSTSAPSRKGSVPTPTSLNAPSLGRSPSASSIGSNASSSFPPRRRRSFATRPSYSTGHTSTPSSAGIYLSAGLANPPDASSPSSRETTMSIPPPRRPFHLMRLVSATMSSGGYISEKLFVPAQIWTTQGGAKLVAIETKVRMLDLLSNGLDGLEKAGRGLLLVPTGSASARAVARQEADRFARELDSFEGLAEGIQSTLAKKLGPGVVGGLASAYGGDVRNGRKGSSASFASWSSKLSHSLNRVTNGTSLDSQAAYVDAVAKVFRQAQCLDEHLACALPGARSADDDSPYDLLDRNARQHLERYLRRSGDFFGHVICRFVLQDVGALLDKYVKRGGAWLAAD
ncbi:hypothetical protein JCM10908_002210 [Rhodotorula pacifica]|uniref:uncharacterized protein n=1 Tax=Rhodotorula pacifica TaxID=1495444 RepID=UPI00316BC645